ncbi:MAG: hypothetical protein M9882_06030 [Homoserinimonas sp.]|nr:hypothetical protein [Homoserinimonas sp.]
MRTFDNPTTDAAEASEALRGLAHANGTSGRIAWRPAPSDSVPAQWVGIVFLQGQDADEVLAIIDQDGAGAAIEHLAGFDMGEETTQAALVNGYVYDTIPTGPLDRTTTEGAYTLTYNHDHRHVSLLRAHPETREPDAGAPAGRIAPSRPLSRRQVPVVEDEDDWFAPSQSSSTSRGRAL